MYKGQHACQRSQYALAAFSSSVGVSPPSSCGLASPHLFSLAGSLEFFGRIGGRRQGRRGRRAGARQRGSRRRRFPWPRKTIWPFVHWGYGFSINRRKDRFHVTSVYHSVLFKAILSVIPIPEGCETASLHSSNIHGIVKLFYFTM